MESKRRFHFEVAVSGLLIVAIMTSGCVNFRKKFIRQKKKDAEQGNEFIPVLEPEVYPDKVYSPSADYKYHYSLWQVWSKELSTAITNNESQKRQLYMLSQAMAQIDEMQKLVTEDKQKEFNDVLKRLGSLQETLKKPAAMHDPTVIQSQIRGLERTMRENLSFDKVEASLIQ